MVSIYRTINVKPRTKKRFRSYKEHDKQTDDKLMTHLLDKLDELKLLVLLEKEKEGGD